MDEKNKQIAHRRIVAGRGIPRNHARIKQFASHRRTAVAMDVLNFLCPSVQQQQGSGGEKPFVRGRVPEWLIRRSFSLEYVVVGVRLQRR